MRGGPNKTTSVSFSRMPEFAFFASPPQLKLMSGDVPHTGGHRFPDIRRDGDSDASSQYISHVAIQAGAVKGRKSANTQYRCPACNFRSVVIGCRGGSIHRGVDMRSAIFSLLCISIVLTACAAPMRMREIESVRANCGSVNRQIAMLEEERRKNNNRLLAGVQSVAPALAAFNLVRGTYGRNVMIATGEWARAIDAKLVQLRRKRARCRRRA